MCVGKNEKKEIFEHEQGLYIDSVDVKRKSSNAYTEKVHHA